MIHKSGFKYLYNFLTTVAKIPRTLYTYIYDSSWWILIPSFSWVRFHTTNFDNSTNDEDSMYKNETSWRCNQDDFLYSRRESIKVCA